MSNETETEYRTQAEQEVRLDGIKEMVSKGGMTAIQCFNQMKKLVEYNWQSQQAQRNNTKPIADAVKHLNDWLSMGLCECEGPGHSCGATQIRNTIEGLEKLLNAPPAPAAVPEGLVSAVKTMLENDGRDGTYSAIRFNDARELVKHYIYAAPAPAEPDSQCCCGETDDAWRLCPEHGPDIEEGA